MYMTK
jgi:hypothetical protein